MEVRLIPGQAELGTVEIRGVGAGDFQPELWEVGNLHFLPDIRQPLIEPLKRGGHRNIYAPSAVETDDGWRLFYGGWDGVDTGHDRIYSVNTSDFVDFHDRQVVIEHGEFIHICNVSALKLPNGEFRLMCTSYPVNGLNKPILFTSPDGRTWNGQAAPYPASMKDLITIEGYDKFEEADINGMNVILYERGTHRLYFNNFKDFGRVYRASSRDGRTFKLDGSALEFGAVVNDVKKFTVGGKPYYLMGLHWNQDKLWYSLSNDGLKFRPAKELARNLHDRDRYIVAIGWATKENRLLGYLYGAGQIPSLDRNRIWARWLQKKVVFTANDGTRYEPSSALGPDRQIITIPHAAEGNFTIYSEDGSTVLRDNIPGQLIPGGTYTLVTP